MGIVYCAINKTTNKVYIGFSLKSLESRKHTHFQQSKNENLIFHFYQAIRKYGFEDFRWHILDRSESPEELKLMEQEYICLFGTRFPEIGYNSTDGGEGCVGNEETRHKQSIHNIGKHSMSISQRHYHRMRRLGCTLSDSTKQKISDSLKEQQSNKGRVCTPQQIEQMRLETASRGWIGDRNPFYGHHHTDDTKRRISQNRKGQRTGTNNLNFGKHLSSEHKLLLSQQHKIAVRCCETNSEYPSALDASAETGICYTSINKCCRKTRKTAGHLHWEYVHVDLKGEIL
jgi:group I intron endonuclease